MEVVKMELAMRGYIWRGCQPMPECTPWNHDWNLDRKIDG
jgi:hypothetical protein